MIEILITFVFNIFISEKALEILLKDMPI